MNKLCSSMTMTHLVAFLWSDLFFSLDTENNNLKDQKLEDRPPLWDAALAASLARGMGSQGVAIASMPLGLDKIHGTSMSFDHVRCVFPTGII